MANAFNDLSQVLAELGQTFPPQTLTVTGAGAAINVQDVGMQVINARLLLGDATALTSLAVKIQAAYDDGSGSPTGWTDVLDEDGNAVAFTTVTVDPGTTGNVPETISFQMPTALDYSTGPYIYARAYATLTGTNILMAVEFLATRKYDQESANQSAPGNNGNGVIN